MNSPGKYARMELERRFLLSPSEAIVSTLPKTAILDNYITGTNLRLRQMENAGTKVYKLGKKTNISPGKEQITTIYLSEAEYALLTQLRAIVVSKIRFVGVFNRVTIGIDVYGSETEELWVAEVEFETEEDMDNFIMPLPHQIEITGMNEFSGFALSTRFGVENRSF
jgi:CYTH domain-containing protein